MPSSQVSSRNTLLQPWKWPAVPRQDIHFNVLRSFLSKMMLVAVDSQSKWPEALEMSTRTRTKTVTALREMLACYGLLEQVVTDNGPQFASSEFSQFLAANGVKHIQCLPYNSRMDSRADSVDRESGAEG